MVSSTLPKWIACFKTKDEDSGKRQTWMSRNTFLLAAIGSAVGLGNFWRFPSLVNKFGGAGFLIPYFMALILCGIPMLLLEIGLGQKFQKGDIGVFGGIHPKLAGIGAASIWSGYVITWYYNVILGWAIRYFFESFKSPLPWDVAKFENRIRTGSVECLKMPLAQE